MGTMTLSEMIEEVQVGMSGRRDDDPVVLANRITRWINAAYDYLCQPNIVRHPELVAPINVGTLTTDVTAYPIPTTDFNYYAIAQARIAESAAVDARLEILTPTRLRGYWEMRSQMTSNGQPEWYAPISLGLTPVRTMLVFPRPSAQFNGWLLDADVWRKPVPLTAGLTTVLRADWDWVIVQGAVWWGYRSMSNFQAAELAKQDFDALINNQLDVWRVEAEDMNDGVGFVDFEPYSEVITL